MHDLLPRPNPGPMGAITKFNPSLWNADEVRQAFVARSRELTQLLEAVQGATPDAAPQHWLLVGTRGMGKTTLLRRVLVAVEEDPDLDPKWDVLGFPEEQYTVAHLSDFWGNCLDALADTLQRRQADPARLVALDQAIAALGSIRDEETRARMSLELLLRQARERGRRLLLLVDRMDMLLASLQGTTAPSAKGGRPARATDGPTLWSLRETLSNTPELLVIGASYQAMEVLQPYSDAFHDFFATIELAPLGREELGEVLRSLARQFGFGQERDGTKAEALLVQRLKTQPGRLHTLWSLTGGNPRAAVLLFGLLSSGGLDDLQADLRRLLDEVTPLYQSRMELLPDQQRQILAYLMEAWDPQTVAQLETITRLPKTSLSAQLSRLEAEGHVQKVSIPGTRKAAYQASERLFNIWHLMRNAPRRARQRLVWVVAFLKLWYSTEELADLAGHRMTALRQGRPLDSSGLESTFALADCLPGAHPVRRKLLLAVAETVGCRKGAQLQDDLMALLDLEGEERPIKDILDYQTRLAALDEALSRCPHLKTAEERQAFAHRVKRSLLPLPIKESIAQKCETATEEAFLEMESLLEKLETVLLQSLPSEAALALKEAVAQGRWFPEAPVDAYLPEQMEALEAHPLAYALALRNLPQTLDASLLERLHRRALELDPTHGPTWTSLGELLADRLDRPVEAEAAYRHAIELNPADPDPWFTLGNLFVHHLANYEEAEAAYRRVIELAPDAQNPWINLGVVLAVHLGRHKEAEAAYNRAIELDPTAALAWTNLGNLLRDHLANYEKAEAAYRRALQLDSSLVHAWNGLGDLLQDRLGRPEEAEVAYARALELDPGDPFVLSNLARLKAGRSEAEAREGYRASLEALTAWEQAPGREIDARGIRLQAHLWLGNADLAAQALETLLVKASAGSKAAFGQLKVQSRELHRLGRGPALAALMEASPYAAFAQPFALALRAAAGEPEALGAAAAEVRAVAEDVSKAL